MALGFEYKLSKSFDIKRTDLFNSLRHTDINKFIYTLGITLESRHLSSLEFGKVDKYAPIFKNLWDGEIWRRVTWGTDDMKNNEESSDDFDQAMATMSYFDYLISQAVKYNRPAWSIFGLIGMMQGTLNRNHFEVMNNEYKLDKIDFIRCLKYIDTEFWFWFANDIMHLFTYFDECGYKLVIKKEEGEILFSIEDPGCK
ncbi:MAG: hypothetical protein IM607_12375 [Cytophagales bacterium]|nr:hypothetical protein [Cytophagales bacterium]